VTKDAMVMKAPIINFGECEKLKRNYPNAQMLIWSEEAWLLLGA